MAWRMVMRRCPVRSMTLVGDLAQTGDAAGASSWAQRAAAVRRPGLALRGTDRQLPHADGDHRRRRPGAGRDRSGADSHPPLCRSSGSGAVVARTSDPAGAGGAGRPSWQSSGRSGREVRRAASGRARAGVAAFAGGVGEGVRRDCPTTRVDRRTWMPAVVVLTVREAKGLEFDSVILVEPDRIVAESARGPQRPLRGDHQGHPAPRRALQRDPLPFFAGSGRRDGDGSGRGARGRFVGGGRRVVVRAGRRVVLFGDCRPLDGEQRCSLPGARRGRRLPPPRSPNSRLLQSSQTTAAMFTSNSNRRSQVILLGQVVDLPGVGRCWSRRRRSTRPSASSARARCPR